MELKVGKQYRLKLPKNWEEFPYVEQDMLRYDGEIVTISSCESSKDNEDPCCCIEEDGWRYYYHVNWMEDIGAFPPSGPKSYKMSLPEYPALTTTIALTLNQRIFTEKLFTILAESLDTNINLDEIPLPATIEEEPEPSL